MKSKRTINLATAGLTAAMLLGMLPISVSADPIPAGVNNEYRLVGSRIADQNNIEIGKPFKLKYCLRPEGEARRPRIDLAMVLDTSGSMNNPVSLNSPKKRIDALKDSSKIVTRNFTEANAQDRIGLVQFNILGTTMRNLTTNYTELDSVINDFVSNGFTNIDHALTLGENMLSGSQLLSGGKSVTSSSAASSNSADKAVDRNRGTYWESSSSQNEWIQVDLGDKYLLDRISVQWDATYYAKEYKVMTSEDGAVWSDAYSSTTGNGSMDSIVPNSTTVARYVKVQSTKRNDRTKGYVLDELEVFGKPVTGAQSSLGIPNEISPNLILLTDGYANFSFDDTTDENNSDLTLGRRAALAHANVLKAKKINVYTIALAQEGGGDVDLPLLQSLATTPGNYFEANNSQELDAAFDEITRRIEPSVEAISVTHTDKLPATFQLAKQDALGNEQVNEGITLQSGNLRIPFDNIPYSNRGVNECKDVWLIYNGDPAQHDFPNGLIQYKVGAVEKTAPITDPIHLNFLDKTPPAAELKLSGYKPHSKYLITVDPDPTVTVKVQEDYSYIKTALYKLADQPWVNEGTDYSRESLRSKSQDFVLSKYLADETARLGKHTVTVKSDNTVGISSGNIPIVFYVENPPVISFSYQDQEKTGNPKLTITAEENLTEISKIRYNFSGFDKPWQHEETFDGTKQSEAINPQLRDHGFSTASADGKYTIYIEAVNTVGQVQRYTGTVTVDTTAPVLSLDILDMDEKTPNGTPLISVVSDPHITLTATEDITNIALIKYKLDGAADWTETTFQTNLKKQSIPINPHLANGWHKLELASVNGAGLPSSQDYFILVNTGPDATLTSSVETGKVSNKPVRVTVKDYLNEIPGAYNQPALKVVKLQYAIGDENWKDLKSDSFTVSTESRDKGVIPINVKVRLVQKFVGDKYQDIVFQREKELLVNIYYDQNRY